VGYAFDRIEHFQDLFDVDDDQLGVLLDPCYRQYDDVVEGDRLPEDEQYWELLVYASNTEWLRDPDMEANANMTLTMEYPEEDAEEFLGVTYPATLTMFERKYSDEIDFFGFANGSVDYL
jgi:hypothetical protein